MDHSVHKITVYRIVSIALLIVLALLMLFPLYWIITGSVKGAKEINARVPSFFPVSPTTANYAKLFSKPAWTWLLNTVFICGMTMPMLALPTVFLGPLNLVLVPRLARACAALNIPLVHGAIQGWYAQVAVIPPGCDLLDRLYPAGEPAAGDKSSLAFTPALCAALQASEAVKLLCGRDSPLAGKLLCADLLNQDYEVLSLPPESV